MAVMLNTSVGDLVIDLFTDQCPLATKNFLKLCKYVLLPSKLLDLPLFRFNF